MPRHADVIGAVLPGLFLVEAIIAKSRFDGLIGGWRGHMILTVAGIALLIAVGLWRRTRLPFSYGPSRSVSIILAVAGAWALLSCIVQPNAYANVVFLAVFAANIYACLYIAPNLVLPHLGERGVLVYAIPIFAATLVNLVFGHVAPSEAFQQDRLAGMSDNATHSALIAAIAAIIALWLFLQWNAHSKVWFAIWVVSVLTLLITRTRANIVSCAVGCAVMLVCWARWQQTLHRKRYVAVTLMAAIMLMGVIVIGSPERVLRARTYLRAGDTEELFLSRMTHWKAGTANLREHPLFGEGPMAKFGGTNDPTVNTYAMEKTYCNAALAFAQAYGIPGALLFALIWVEILRFIPRRQVGLPLLLIGIIVSGTVSSLGHMWLVSFGTPSDRATWLIVGLALATPASQCRKNTVAHRKTIMAGSWPFANGLHRQRPDSIVRMRV